MIEDDGGRTAVAARRSGRGRRRRGTVATRRPTSCSPRARGPSQHRGPAATAAGGAGARADGRAALARGSAPGASSTARTATCCARRRGDRRLDDGVRRLPARDDVGGPRRGSSAAHGALPGARPRGRSAHLGRPPAGDARRPADHRRGAAARRALVRDRARAERHIARRPSPACIDSSSCSRASRRWRRSTPYAPSAILVVVRGERRSRRQPAARGQ